MKSIRLKSFLTFKSFLALYKRKVYTQRGKAKRIFVSAMRKIK